MRGPQDYGGLPAGPVDPVKNEHVPTHWEKTVDALMMLIFDQRRQLARVDESRRMQEAFGEDYHKYPYYERWLQAVSWLMLEKSVFTVLIAGRKRSYHEAIDLPMRALPADRCVLR